MPDELVSYNENPAAKAVAEFAANAVNNGIEVTEVAHAVEHAVRTNTFWILTHEHAAVRTTEQRIAWMLGGPPPGINLDKATKP